MPPRKKKARLGSILPGRALRQPFGFVELVQLHQVGYKAPSGLQTLKISGQIYTSLNALRPSTGDLFDDTAGGKNKFGAYAQVYLIINPEDTQFPAGVHKRAFSDPTACEIAALLPSLYDGELMQYARAMLIEHVDNSPPANAFKLDDVPVRPNLLTITGGYLSSSMCGSAQWYRARFHDAIQVAIDSPILLIAETRTGTRSKRAFGQSRGLGHFHDRKAVLSVQCPLGNVSMSLPDPELDPFGHWLVCELMIHGPHGPNLNNVF